MKFNTIQYNLLLKLKLVYILDAYMYAFGHRTVPWIYISWATKAKAGGACLGSNAHAVCVTFISVEFNTNSLNLTLVNAEWRPIC